MIIRLIKQQSCGTKQNECNTPKIISYCTRANPYKAKYAQINVIICILLLIIIIIIIMEFPPNEIP